MKPIILRQHEVIHLRDTGSVIAWRIVKQQPVGKFAGPNFDGLWSDTVDPVSRYFACPYGLTGEERWVKETWSRDAVTMYPCPVAWYKASDHIESGSFHDCPQPRSVPYADCLACWEERYRKFQWRSSATMPRWASRFTVTLDVGLKRIQEVTEEEAKMSGVPEQRHPHGGSTIPHFYRWHGLREIIQAKNRSDWDMNLWHWKITCTLKK